MHPFRARRNANDTAHWIDAGDLVAGEQIETQDGRWVAVQSVTPISGLSIVYNFTVEEDHDYFVGDEGLLVHNEGSLPDGVDPYQLSLWPATPYNRTADYGYTPTAAQRASVPAGMEFDHDPPLVQHYYEGPGDGSLPGFNLTQAEREAYATSLEHGGAATPAFQRAQGRLAAYSKRMKWGCGLR